MNNRVSEIALIPSLYCNLQCDHCCRSAGPHRRERMTDEVFNRLWYVMQEITEDSEPDLIISGGEPLIWRKKFIMRLINHLPSYAFRDVYIATNGTWTKSEARRHWFLKTLVPALNTLLISYPDTGLNVDLSRDQFHYPVGVEKSWQCLKRELSDGFPDADTFDRYYCPDPEEVKLTKRPTYMQTILPIGRGYNHASYNGGDKTHCHFDGNSPRIENTLTIWPDGRVSACCDGGAWVGNVMVQDWREILHGRRAFLFHLRREVGAYDDGNENSRKRVTTGVPIGTCGDCKEIGKAYFNTTFSRRENGISG